MCCERSNGSSTSIGLRKSACGWWGVARWYQFAGYQANPLPFVKHAQLFCLPSLYEGMPNALIEAMICGTPVIASDCPSGPREILGEESGFGGLVPVADADALADAVANAISEYPRVQAKAIEARRHIVESYSLKPGLRRLEALFDELIGD
ncbi:MAG: glycosyltransferase [Planctomycetia bacterium]|nr:glycosyltransferase [Planctomycetia bacterium]